MKNHPILLITILFIVFNYYVTAQESVEHLSEEDKIETVNSVAKIIKENYVFPEVANKIEKLLINNYKNGNYSIIKDPFEFASELTKDVQSFNQDSHLRVFYEPKLIAEQKLNTVEDSKKVFSKIETHAKMNFGFEEVKILGGNIGYFNMKYFAYPDPEYASVTVASVMNFLGNTDAIIIDMRESEGGWSEMVQLITSYFFGHEPILLYTSHTRDTTEMIGQTWTLPYVHGKRRPDVPLYILTSKIVRSAGEAFCFFLQSQNRAILVGETTVGAANAGWRITATDKFNVWTPQITGESPITNANWEGVGVIPDINTSSEDAFSIANIMALDSLASESTDKKMKKVYEWDLLALRANKNPVTIDMPTLKTYVGKYGIRIITLENNRLFYQKEKSTKFELIPLDINTFKLKELSYFRVRLIKDNGKVVALRGMYDDGDVIDYQRDKE